MTNKTCNHYNWLKGKLTSIIPWKKKKECTELCWKDEAGKEHNYCQKHICVFCKKSFTTEKGWFKKKVGEKIGKDSEGKNFYLCHRQNCWVKNYLRAKELNGEAEAKLREANEDLIKEKLAKDAKITSQFRAEIEPFLNDLANKERDLILMNFQPKPFFTADNLKEIRDFIDQRKELRDIKKRELKIIYNNSKGQIDNIINGKETFFLDLGRDNKMAEDFAKLSTKRANFCRQLRNLDDWNLLGFQKQQNFIDQIASFDEEKLDDVIKQAEAEIKRIKDERERDKDKNPKEIPPQNPSPQFPSPSPDNNSDKLAEAKKRVKTEHNLSEEEFNFVIVPITDKDLLEYVSLLIGKVKESQAEGKSLDKVYTLLEFLISYRDATGNSLKKNAYQVVNSFQNQVDLAIQKLENGKNLAGNHLKRLVASQNQAELEIIYNEIKKAPEFSQTESQKIVDNHLNRTREAIKLETDSATTEIEKKIAKKLRVVINGDTEKNFLENFQKEIKEFQSSSDPEKKAVYNKHRQIIEATLAEIASELNRRNQSKQDQSKIPAPTDNQSKTPPKKDNFGSSVGIWLLSAGLLIVVVFLGYQIIKLRKKRLVKKIKSAKKKKKKKNSKIILYNDD